METEKLTIRPCSFLKEYGIIVNPKYAQHVTRSSLSEAKTAVQDLLGTSYEKPILFLQLLGITEYVVITHDMSLLPDMKQRIGTLEDYIWLLNVVTLAKAKPDDEKLASDGFFPDTIHAIVLSRFETVYPPLREDHLLNQKPTNWVAVAQHNTLIKDAPTLLSKHNLLELDRGSKRQKLSTPVEESHTDTSSFVSDWSGASYLLPTIIHMSVWSPCMVVVPPSRVSQVAKLIAINSEYIGIKPNIVVDGFVIQENLDIKGCIIVCSPSPNKNIEVPLDLQFLALFETDVLLSLGFEQQVEKLLCAMNPYKGVHAGTKSAAVNDLVSRLLPAENTVFWSGPQPTLENVDDPEGVDSETEDETAGSVWKNLGKLGRKMKNAIFYSLWGRKRRQSLNESDMCRILCASTSGIRWNSSSSSLIWW